MKIDVMALAHLDQTMAAAHLPDRLTDCGCSKRTLRICVGCHTVVCACKVQCPCDVREAQFKAQAERVRNN